jgi:organic hydroperoxide reductase OsmC/OhrA
MVSISVNLANVEGTEAALGWAGSHTLVADRASGKAGGMGLGFNGGELLALAIGGCLANDLRYAAHEQGVAIGRIEIGVTIELDGAPLLVTGARVRIVCETSDGSDPRPVVEKARAETAVGNSVARGFPVVIEID